MSIFENLNKLLGKRPADEPPAPGYEHFGGEPADPRNNRYWRSVPHPDRIAIPTMADYLIEIVHRTRAHVKGIDDATGPFLFDQIDAEAEAVGAAIEERYRDQIRTEQGLWADEDTLAYRQQQKAEILKAQLQIADTDYREARDALLGEPGATPAWNAGITGTRHTPALPTPSVAPSPTSDNTVHAAPGPDQRTDHTASTPNERNAAANAASDTAEAQDELDEAA
ncbi:hypothetical protein [Pseudarthrobacter sp. B4EP4b]|uniref:hypothetical protein n=1 Tax=Pseudarthrobacter sp. B4EP4b TaxID=2590664 RepID=UPI001151DE2C|nr:hypothetical protein [Pseudarthrobacter sp. B4EP4b]